MAPTTDIYTGLRVKGDSPYGTKRPKSIEKARCTLCKGKGMLLETKKCPRCNGTGNYIAKREWQAERDRHKPKHSLKATNLTFRCKDCGHESSAITVRDPKLFKTPRTCKNCGTVGRVIKLKNISAAKAPRTVTYVCERCRHLHYAVVRYDDSHKVPGKCTECKAKGTMSRDIYTKSPLEAAQVKAGEPISPKAKTGSFICKVCGYTYHSMVLASGKYTKPHTCLRCSRDGTMIRGSRPAPDVIEAKALEPLSPPTVSYLCNNCGFIYYSTLLDDGSHNKPTKCLQCRKNNTMIRDARPPEDIPPSMAAPKVKKSNTGIFICEKCGYMKVCKSKSDPHLACSNCSSLGTMRRSVCRVELPKAARIANPDKATWATKAEDVAKTVKPVKAVSSKLGRKLTTSPEHDSAVATIEKRMGK